MHALLDGSLSKSLKCHLSWQRVSQGVVLSAQEKGVLRHKAFWVLGKTSHFSLSRP